MTLLCITFTVTKIVSSNRSFNKRFFNGAVTVFAVWSLFHIKKKNGHTVNVYSSHTKLWTRDTVRGSLDCINSPIVSLNSLDSKNSLRSTMN